VSHGEKSSIQFISFVIDATERATPHSRSAHQEVRADDCADEQDAY
jgi:hypothetical protein